MNKVLLGAQVEGEFEMFVYRPDGRLRAHRHFKNLVLDAGLNRIGSANNNGNACFIGTGTTPPVFSNTALEAQVASRNGQTSAESLPSSGSSPYYAAHRRNWRFPAGSVVTPNPISEIGVGSGTPGQPLFSRSLVKNIAGDPEPVMIASDEYVDVFHTTRLYADEADRNQTLVIFGVERSITARASQLPLLTNFPQYFLDSGMYGVGGTSGLRQVITYAGPIGPITGLPTTQLSTAGIILTQAPYVDGSLKNTFTAEFPLTSANHVNGVRSLQLNTNTGFYQIQFDPALEKNENRLMTLSFELAWSRKD